MAGVSIGGVGRIGKALVVDDLAESRKIVGDRLAEAGFAVLYAEDGLDAFDRFVRSPTDLIVTDWQLPRLNGIGLVRRIREISDVPVVMMTASGSIPDCEEAMRVGADRYLQFRRDLDRLGSVARALMKNDGRNEGLISTTVVMTAVEARSLGQHELRTELQNHLFDCRGNMAEMARRMGKDRSTIRYHLRRFGMLGSDTSGPDVGSRRPACRSEAISDSQDGGPPTGRG